ncbi:Fic family protein [Oceanicella sp. SM1341]|uniref:Fic/DOC family protein n=1 Tax=Oceanicella sp. SM1341 TaxID=1548889 RepID=UPI000E5126AF|nr:Fic family protein [Oceanicella sp. SM1341]
MVFDPFGDFDTQGYLRNSQGLTDPESVRHVEHSLFLANLDDAIDMLRTRKVIDYGSFLDVHRILFEDFYPWAGQDRLTTAPALYITKGEAHFAQATEIRMAVDWGLTLADRNLLENCGTVLGQFALGHPFLDGNGRTIMLVFGELCYRAGFGIAWEGTDKTDYLDALTRELDDPRPAPLNAYLAPYIAARVPHEAYSKTLNELPGLSGMERFIDEGREIAGYTSDPGAKKAYEAYMAARNAAIRIEQVKTVKS